MASKKASSNEPELERWIDDQRYIRRGRELEHRQVMKEFLKEELPPGAVVHHRNRVRHDNRLENLLLIPSDDMHQALHQRLRLGSAAEIEEIEEPCLAWAELIRDHHLRGEGGPLPAFSGSLRRKAKPILILVEGSSGRRRFVVRSDTGNHR